MTIRMVVVVLVAVTCSVAGCGKTTVAATQVMVAIDAASAVRAGTHDVHVVVRSGQGEVSTWEDRYDKTLTPDADKFRWPLEFSLLPKGGDATRVYEVTATALDAAGVEIASERAISGYLAHRTLLLRLKFDDACIGKVATCTATETCTAGNCVDAHVAVTLLVPYSGNGNASSSPSGADAGADAAAMSAGGPGVAKVGDSCTTVGAVACDAHDSKLPVKCNAGGWQGQSQCDDNSRCDTRQGGTLGTCQPIVSGCQALKPGDTFCSTDATAIQTCGADRVSVTDLACAAGERCSADTVVDCVCKPGYSPGASGCTDIDECKTDNGGCDALTTCTNTPGGRTCGACPPGDLGDGVNGCTPALTGLTLSTGALSPALSPSVTDYSVQISLVTQTLTL